MNATKDFSNQKIWVVGSYWAQISGRAEPTMLTKDEAQAICDKWNAEDVEVRAGNSPFFVTTNIRKAAH